MFSGGCYWPASVECLFPRMQRVQCRALTCLHNILSAMDMEALGGATALRALAEHLSKLVFGTPGKSASTRLRQGWCSRPARAIRHALLLPSPRDPDSGGVPGSGHQRFAITAADDGFQEHTPGERMISMRISAVSPPSDTSGRKSIACNIH